MTYSGARVNRVKDADGAVCRDCGETFGRFWDLNMPWSWRKSQWLHQRGTGHKMDLFKVTEVTP